MANQLNIAKYCEPPGRGNSDMNQEATNYFWIFCLDILSEPSLQTVPKVQGPAKTSQSFTVAFVLKDSHGLTITRNQRS